jgi:hypothetical protein
LSRRRPRFLCRECGRSDPHPDPLAGDDPAREGLLDTPARVARAWKEYARGYEEDPAAH